MTKKSNEDLLKTIDLSKARGQTHPDIIPHTQHYLIKYNAQWHLGFFHLQWYGLNFRPWGTSGLQFDAPGSNSSRWEAVLAVDIAQLDALVGRK
jgi:hypothetical protein